MTEVTIGSLTLAVALAIPLAGAVSCAQGVGGGANANAADAGANSGDDDDQNTDDTGNSNSDSGAFGDDADGATADTGTSTGGGDSGGGTMTGDDDSSTPDTGTVASGTCSSIGSGDLMIVEIMIKSQSGAGDLGEWVEIQNQRTDCSVALSNITVSSPRGSTASDSVTINTGRLIAPGATFIVAGSSSASVNHNLPSPVYAWNQPAGDILANGGDEVKVLSGSTVIDDFTYPDITLNTARSYELSSACPPGDTDFSHWASATHEYANVGGVSYDGTPNAPNTDVTCN